MTLNDLPKSEINEISDLPNEHSNKLLKVALTISQPQKQDCTKALDRLQSDLNLQPAKLLDLIAVYVAIVRLFTELTDKEFVAKLAEIGFSTGFIDNLPLISNRKEVFDAISRCKRSDYGKLVSLKWRIDISLNDSLLVKKVPNSVVLSFVLKNGRKITVNVDLKTFHKLRFNVALIVRELTTVKSNILCT